MGKTAIRMFNKFRELRKRYWGSHFWSRGYYVSTIGRKENTIRESIRNQDQLDGGVLGEVTTNLPTNYPALLDEIKQRIRASQYEGLKAVNKEMIALYWDIGRLIVER